MTICTSCGTENSDGMRFCVKCGAALAPDPGSWKAPSGNLYDAPSQTPSGGLNQPGSYAPPVQSGYGGGGGAMMASGIGGFPYAEWIDRVLAALIDGAIAAGVMIVLYIIFGVIGGVLGAIGSGLGDDAGGAIAGIGSLSCCVGFGLAGLSVFVVGIYNKVFLVSKRGFSIGQGIMKLKVVDQNGNIPQTGTLVLRLLVQVAIGFIPIIGFFLGLANVLWPLWDQQRQTLHDKAVGTFVLKTG